ncbi:MAG: putative toxin-antitoxin system toxin component, PIN family [Oscillospiraceae bacterium]|nr:putative toxin-antitoxin system toxin component, PIN family [Oscillospiraceae bacterium]MBR7084081.1 putative toxin-antitoxin system toxin component, PIN family [Oscillospiraceae bacterium]
MICYAVIDTNILVSSLLSKNTSSATVQIILKMLDGDIIPIYSKEIMTEYQEVLSRKKFHFPIQQVNYLLNFIKKFGILVNPSKIEILLPDMKDLPFYEVIMEKHSDNTYLVTGNLKHFPKENFIISARELLELLETQ